MATPTLPRPPAAPLTDESARERRRGPDRRQPPGDRRHARRDRRRGRPDVRATFVERRQGPPDRRSGRPDRRLGGDRRTALRAPKGPPLVDPDVAFWALNVLCWTAVTVVALVYGA